MDFQLVVDNDAFTLDLSQDQYYSSGIYAAARFLMDSTRAVKRVRTYQLNHRIYTPSWIGWDSPSLLDRPYAGTLSATLGNEYYFPGNHYLKAHLEIGWMGPGSLVGQTQKTWHRWFGMPEPKGWKYQINNSPIVNLHLKYAKALISTRNFELVSESTVSAGSIYNLARQELVVRFGELKPLSQSAYVSASIGNQKEKRIEPSLTEIYFFYAPGLEYVLYNATLEGNLIGKKSEYATEAIDWVWQHKAGLMMSWPRFDLAFTAYWRTRENPEALPHDYVAIRMNQRF
ncbi:hypothetical protein C7460_13024 [Marinoscillum furvescens DSM 4134]|uniref:Lipid A deacylase LpxR family protein n=2 Tax=Marinoscillum furvescens TaxID=1026 RepID=A0A3D9KWE3_MARFU|nr:hypothetical protein C7460_13024 [Marinoscillum furvescens DSM 4134]